MFSDGALSMTGLNPKNSQNCRVRESALLVD
jgi:hypothetical protein